MARGGWRRMHLLEAVPVRILLCTCEKMDQSQLAAVSGSV